MSLSKQIAKHLREIHFGGNWTFSNLKDTLADVTWEQATTKVYSFNTILALTYHINYFIKAVLEVLNNRPLTAKDKYSFDHPPIQNQKEWEAFLDSLWEDAENFAELIEQLPELKLNAVFVENKYGNYYRNLHGIIEHSHYHLGQISIIKKIIQQTNKEQRS